MFRYRDQPDFLVYQCFTVAKGLFVFVPDFPLFCRLSFSFWSVRFCGLVSYYFSFSLFSGRFTRSLSWTFPLVCVACPFCTSLSPVLWALSPGDTFLTKDLFSSFFRSLTLRMAEKWSTLHGWNQRECVDRYLENARRWPFFGCKLFQAQVWEKKPPSYGCKAKAGFHLIAGIKQIPALFLPVVAIQMDGLPKTGTTISGMVWADKRYIWLVSGCLEYHRPIIINPCPPKRYQKSLRRKLVPMALIVLEWGIGFYAFYERHWQTVSSLTAKAYSFSC